MSGRICPCRWFHSVGDPKLSADSALLFLRYCVRGVQNKRDYIVPKIADETEAQKYSHELMANLSPSDNETVQRSSQSAFQRVNQPLSIQRVSALEPFNQPTSSQWEMPHILMKITQNYRQLCAVRKSTELSMNGSTLRSMFDDCTRGVDLVTGSTQKTSNILRSHLPALAEFVNNTFEEFALLNQEEKWSVFRSFIALSFGMDTFYRTYRLVPPELYATMSVITETTFIDSNDMVNFFADAPSNKLGREELCS
ncbi:hypothetical protein Y032_0132g1695 [Ancylostoma ceylanicum]|uniref:NR LBD domain-containing protein n=1 Tax=Ancylostoma ceylanicum TaxID=53326 RepID=A0A016T6I4_9BILA|nr:hypothetical protein Y032_0132g1695 [Ancylostoma ceylanicum]